MRGAIPIGNLGLLGAPRVPLREYRDIIRAILKGFLMHFEAFLALQKQRETNGKPRKPRESQGPPTKKWLEGPLSNHS